MRYHIKSESDSGGTSHNIDLYLTRPEDLENEIHIDCSSLGFDKFIEMFELIGGEDEPVKLEVQRKEV
jgi:hypothetical protein